MASGVIRLRHILAHGAIRRISKCASTRHARERAWYGLKNEGHTQVGPVRIEMSDTDPIAKGVWYTMSLPGAKTLAFGRKLPFDDAVTQASTSAGMIIDMRAGNFDEKRWLLQASKKKRSYAEPILWILENKGTILGKM